MKCPNCGNRLQKDAKFCGYCGWKVQAEGPGKTGKGKGPGVWIIGILLVLLIGGSGAAIFLFRNTKNAPDTGKTAAEPSEIPVTTAFTEPNTAVPTEAEENAPVICGFYMEQGGTSNQIEIQEVRGDQVTFAVSMEGSKAFKAKGTFREDSLPFDRVTVDGKSVYARGMVEFRGDTLVLTLMECDDKNIRTGQCSFDLAARRFTAEELRAIATMLEVPESLDVEITQGDPSYWEGGAMYRTPIDVYYHGEFVASASVNSVTGGLAGNIYIYHAPETSTGSGNDVASTFGYDQVWDIHDRSGRHYVTILLFQKDGTFYCCAGWYQSDDLIAFTGTYEMVRDELCMSYTFDGEAKQVSYRIDWENRLFYQTSDGNLGRSHQHGSAYPIEEDPWKTPEEFKRMVEGIIRDENES